MFYGSLAGRGVWGEVDTRVCMAESVCCSPETITALLIGFSNIKKRNFRERPNPERYRFELQCFPKEQSSLGLDQEQFSLACPRRSCVGDRKVNSSLFPFS